MKHLKASLLICSLLSISACSTIQHDKVKAPELVKHHLCKVNTNIERNPIPKTPNNMSLPNFGQGVIGWATGQEGAKTRLESIKKSDLKAIQIKGTTLDMVKEWQAFYENEVVRNPCNPTAPYRAQLMKKIAQLWVE
ncbi:DUF4951 domain-containing protein [Acinetobacter sp. ANC 3832]|uniref:DUF4951 domain-containing protein n=1 Tax=Acinetobacter sp. ANC 3832 TaxID=1977874 RepID=UPI000A33F946|nr:DUF4951 domain-containing protein [Acinetobacter sp. ANC 3832]